jgi:predicted transcriptional regulator
MAASDSQRKSGRNPSDPLTHPLRRRILRYLHRCGEPKGAHEVAEALGEGVSQVKYHLRSLENYGTTMEAGTTPEGDALLYESAVSEDAEVLALLEAYEDRDEGRKKAA